MIEKLSGDPWPRLLGIAILIAAIVPTALWAVALTVNLLGWMLGEPAIIRSVE
jgi:hypothetical protein